MWRFVYGLVPPKQFRARLGSGNVGGAFLDPGRAGLLRNVVVALIVCRPLHVIRLQALDRDHQLFALGVLGVALGVLGVALGVLGVVLGVLGVALGVLRVALGVCGCDFCVATVRLQKTSERASVYCQES